MDVVVIVAIVGLIQAVSVAIINGIMNRNRKADEEREQAKKHEEQEREKVRFERDKTTYDLLFAMADAMEVLLKKAHGDKLNGDVEEAMTSVHSAKSRLTSICNAEMARI